MTTTHPEVDFFWEGAPAEGLPADHFSARWTGEFRPARSERAIFTVSGDDGYRLFVDGREVLEHWSDHGVSTKTATLDVEAGRRYAIRLEFYDNIRTAEVKLQYAGYSPAEHAETIASADAVVYCAGFDQTSESENSDRTFALPAGQADEIASVAGGGVDFTPFADRVRAVLLAWYPGQEGGRALADILTGRTNPSGRLPITIERRAEDNPTFGSYYPNVFRFQDSPLQRVSYDEGVFVGYRGYDRRSTEPMYPFGYGLSYSTFEYSDLKVEKRDGGVVVSFAVRNTGGMDAAEVAQVYVGDVEASVPRPAKELKGYEKIFLKKGEQKRVEVTLTDEAFRFYDIFSHGFVTEPGDFNIFVGSSCEDIRLRGGVTL